MMKNVSNKRSSILVFLLGTVLSTSVMAWTDRAFNSSFGPPNIHGHGDSRVYNHGGYRYYDRGGYLYSRPRTTIIIPNVVINVPVEPVYPPLCEDVEVCDNYTGECWLDRICN